MNSIAREMAERLKEEYPFAYYVEETCTVISENIRIYNYDRFIVNARKIYKLLHFNYDPIFEDIDVCTAFCISASYANYWKLKDKLDLIVERITPRIEESTRNIYYISCIIYLLSDDIVVGYQRFLDLIEYIECLKYQVRCKEEYLMLGYLALIDLSEEDERLLDIDWVKITKAPNHLKTLYNHVQKFHPSNVSSTAKYAEFAYQIIENHIRKIGSKL